jgi:DNA-directed RNA polymerase specialized sigma24 family protein
MNKESEPKAASVSTHVVAKGPAPALLRQDSAWNELADRMKRGEAAALSDLYDSTASLVYGLMLRMLGETEASQQALVDAYARAWSRIHTFDAARSNLIAWLILLARGVALEHPSRKTRECAPGMESQSDGHVLERAFFDGVKEGDLRGALERLRQKKGEGA